MPKEVRSIRLSEETIEQFEMYANFYRKLYGKKPTLGKTVDEALILYIKEKLKDTKDTLIHAINSIEKIQNQKGENEADDNIKGSA